MKAMGVELVNN